MNNLQQNQTSRKKPVYVESKDDNEPIFWSAVFFPNGIFLAIYDENGRLGPSGAGIPGTMPGHGDFKPQGVSFEHQSIPRVHPSITPSTIAPTSMKIGDMKVSGEVFIRNLSQKVASTIGKTSVVSINIGEAQIAFDLRKILQEVQSAYTDYKESE